MAFAIGLGEMVMGFGADEDAAWAQAYEENRKIGGDDADLANAKSTVCSAYCAAKGDGHPSVLWRDAAGVLRHINERATVDRSEQPRLVLGQGSPVLVSELTEEQITATIGFLEAGFADEDRRQAESEDAGDGDPRAFIARVARLCEDRTGAPLVLP